LLDSEGAESYSSLFKICSSTFLWRLFWSVIFGAAFIEGIIGTDFLLPIAYFGLLLPYFACAVRRVRDASGNGWFVLIPVYNFILLLSKSKTKDEPNS